MPSQLEWPGAQVPFAIGPFRVVNELGRGGMGVVYHGVHTDTGESAAVKTIASALPSAMFAIRREIQSLGRLRHPGLVRFLGSGVSGGSPWYAMELLVGQTLRDYLMRSRPLDSRTVVATATAQLRVNASGGTDVASVLAPERAAAMGSESLLSLVASVCGTLAYLHDNGVVHRDLKPENIFVQAAGPPILVDLGISGEFAGSRGREQLDGAWFSSLGTLAYMSPEQIRGELVDARADLYAIGCILYECLTGTRLFPGKDSFGLRKAHLQEAPARPSTLVPGISAELDALVLQLLEKEPADRIGYADDVARALSRLSVPASQSVSSSATYLYRPPLVGREEPKEKLVAAIQALVRNGTGAAYFLSGESGVGKTRLANEAVLLASRNDISVVVGQCSSLAVGEEARSSDAPLQAFAPLFLEIADRSSKNDAAETERALGAHGRILAAYQPALAQIPGFEDLPRPQKLEGPEASARVLATAARAILSHTATHPTLLVIDDLQWADELSLKLLKLLTESDLAAAGLLVVGTYRVDEAPPAVRSLGSVASLIELKRFGEDEVGAMVQGMLALQKTELPFVAYLTRQSNGNPFFVVEHLRTAIAERILNRDEHGRWQLSRTRSFDEELAFPSTLSELVRRRLLNLGPDVNRVIEGASVLGRQFDIELLQRSFDLMTDASSDTWALLREKQIFEDCDGGRWRFVHDGLREAAYAQIEPLDLQELHRRAAQALEATHGGSALEPHYADLAHHHAKACAPARASFYFARAGEQARNAFATAAAVRHFESALNELSTLSDAETETVRAGVQEALGELLLFQGEATAASSNLEAAINATDRSKPVVVAGRLRKLARVLERQHRHAEALEIYQRAERELGSPPQLEAAAYWHEFVQIQVDAAWDLYFMGRVNELDALAARAQPLVERHGDAAQRSRFFTSMAQSLAKRSRFRIDEKVLRYTELALSVGEESSDPRERAVAEFARAFPLTLSDEYAAAEPLYLRAVAGAERVGDNALLTRVLAYFGVMLRRAERLNDVRDVAERSRGLSERMRMDDYLGVSHANLAWLARREGDPARCERQANLALEAWARIPSSYVFPLQWLARLPLAAVLSQTDRDESCAEQLAFLMRPDQMFLDDDLVSNIEVGRQSAAARRAALISLFSACHSRKYL